MSEKCNPILSREHHRFLSLMTIRKEFADQDILDLSEQQSRTCFQDHNWTKEQVSSSQTYKPRYAIRFNTPLFGTQYRKHDILTIEKIEKKQTHIHQWRQPIAVPTQKQNQRWDDEIARFNPR